MRQQHQTSMSADCCIAPTAHRLCVTYCSSPSEVTPVCHTCARPGYLTLSGGQNLMLLGLHSCSPACRCLCTEPLSNTQQQQQLQLQTQHTMSLLVAHCPASHSWNQGCRSGGSRLTAAPMAGHSGADLVDGVRSEANSS